MDAILMKETRLEPFHKCLDRADFFGYELQERFILGEKFDACWSVSANQYRLDLGHIVPVL